jgi:predicted HTH transcriptional regulator
MRTAKTGNSLMQDYKNPETKDTCQKILESMPEGVWLSGEAIYFRYLESVEDPLQVSTIKQDKIPELVRTERLETKGQSQRRKYMKPKPGSQQTGEPKPHLSKIEEVLKNLERAKMSEIYKEYFPKVEDPLSHRTLRRRLDTLIDQGKARKEGSRSSTKYVYTG